MSKQWGQPVLSLRLPAKDINGLKCLAKQRGQTVTEILRDMIERRLEEEHIIAPSDQLPGQLSIE